jgi:hypothetical protein
MVFLGETAGPKSKAASHGRRARDRLRELGLLDWPRSQDSTTGFCHIEKREYMNFSAITSDGVNLRCGVDILGGVLKCLNDRVLVI